MSTVMVMHNEMEQLHRKSMEEQSLPSISSHNFEFDQSSLRSSQSHGVAIDISSHNNITETEVYSVSSEDEELCNSILPNRPQHNSFDRQAFPPPSEPISEKTESNIVDASDVTLQLNESIPIENLTDFYSDVKNKKHEQETSDDDLLEELDKVVLTKNNVEEGGEADDNLQEKDGIMVVKKMEALKRRLDYTIQERKHLEIENINLERKIDALVRNHALESKEILGSMEVQKEEVEELKRKLFQQVESSRLDVQKLRADHLREVENLQKKIQDLQKDKDEIVMRFAMAEQKNIEVTDKLQKSELKLKEWSKERETALTRWKTMKAENKRAFDICEAQKNEINQLKKDNDRLKESESSNETKLKWHQNKLKAEQDGHKETSAKLSEHHKTMQELQIHSFAIFDAVRSIYSVLQELHTFQSNQQATPPHMPPSLKQDTSITQLLPIISKDLQTLLWKQREMVSETRTYKDKIHCLELERLSQFDELNSIRDNLRTRGHENEDLKQRITKLQDMEKEHERLIAEVESLSRRAENLEASNAELSADLRACRSRETENMEFNSRLMSENSELKANNDAMSKDLEFKSSSLEVTQTQLSSLQNQLSQLSLEKQTNSMQSSAMAESFKRQLEEANETIKELRTKKQELEDEMKTMNRRHAAMVKDLRRHVAGGRRPLTSDDLKSQPDTGSLCSSHGGSSLSLDTHGGTLVGTQPSTPPSQQHRQADSANQCESAANGDLAEEEEDPNMLLLMRHLDKKTRKISFLKEHVTHLTEELHRKSKIIREYALREESGSLVPEASDKNKAQLSKKGGIMASMYSLSAKDSGMTLSLSMEINQKLQALVEDTLLKNMKYKESMDLLGQEIEWLTGENKSLRTQLHQKDFQPAETKKNSEVS